MQRSLPLQFYSSSVAITASSVYEIALSLFWALVFGFTIASLVRVAFSQEIISNLLEDNGIK